MTTQIRPLTGGAWNNVSQDSGHVTLKSTTWGITLPPALVAEALRAVNTWVNASGIGEGSVRGQDIAAAAGLQIQEV